MNRGQTLSETVPENLTNRLRLRVGFAYTLQLNDGAEAYLYETDSTDPPNIATVADDCVRLRSGSTVEYIVKLNPVEQLWAWDAGAGRIVAADASQST